MSVTVTLHIFSGRPNPTWELSDSQIQELADRIAGIHKQTLLKPPGIVGDLGYRGFSVKSVREKLLDPYVYLHAGIVDTDRFAANRIADNADLESWLLATAGNAMDQSLVKYVEGELAGGGKGYVSTGGSMIIAVPPYDPGKWNNDVNIRTLNNCYNYANDKITNTFAQPGRGGGKVFSAYECGNVGAAAQRDEQAPVGRPSSTPAQGHYIALVVWPATDFHWYRLDNNAKWSHKPGQYPAKNTDYGGNLISDPETCNRGPYTAFCGYYHCIPSNTRIS